MDPERNVARFVAAITASTDYDHRTLAQVSAITGCSEQELKEILRS
jgi:hypothetical protein